jgi:hypothetical protein
VEGFFINFLDLFDDAGGAIDSCFFTDNASSYRYFSPALSVTPKNVSCESGFAFLDEAETQFWVKMQLVLICHCQQEIVTIWLSFHTCQFSG